MSGGVRHALDRAVDRAVCSRVNEGVYLGGLCAASAVSWLLLKVGRHLSR